MTWKSTAASGVGIIAMWAWSVVSSPTPHATAPAAAPQPVPAASAASDIEQQAAKLQARLHSDAPYEVPARNPFRFGVTPIAPRPRVAPAPTVLPVFAPPPFVPEAPKISLAGIAVDVIDGTTVRTAILSTPTGVQLVKENETVEPGYRVSKIEEDAVELLAADGTTRRLALRR
jgi:hypothetical protein